MKKIIIILLSFLSVFSGLNAQNIDDALRYSQVFYGGTARFASMGGAFTAIGGDLSTYSQNPAGIGVFRSSDAAVTTQLLYNNTTSGYNNGLSSDYVYNFNLNQAGFVSNLFSSNKVNGLISFNFGYSFNKTNNFNQNAYINGVNKTSSMADYWAINSDGLYSNELSGAEGLAYDAWIIDTITGTGGRYYETVYSNYGDNPPSVYGQTVRRFISTDGYTGEHAISFGSNYSNKLFLGATFGISQLRFSSYTEHIESTELKLPSQFKNFTYTDYYDNYGTGFTFKLGAIFKPVETLRIGLAYHAPVWYTIDEYFYDNISSKFTDGEHYEYSNDPLRFEYALTTPMRFLGGVAIQIKKVAILSADYEFVNYATARFENSGDGYNYSEKNRSIENSLQSASNFRVGGEYRMGKVYFRGGYGYYGKAFKPGEDNEDLDYSSFSGGTGFRERNFYIDFAYTNFRYSKTYILYPLDSSYKPAISDISTVNNMFALTFGFKFGR